MKLKKSLIFWIFWVLIATACADDKKASIPEFNQYWFNQGAEINRFELKQSRYGEMREGEMTMIFVTEPFNSKEQVKSDTPSGEDVQSTLKLIITRDFDTGVYPYTVMTSIFTPINSPFLPLKISFSALEWCGMVYHQLNQQKDKWISRHYSYFQTEGDKELSVKKVFTEDGLLNLIRLSPQELPVGNFLAIPSLWFIRSQHQGIKSHEVTGKAKLGEYKLTYHGLDRELVIRYQVNFPHRIISLEETHFDGWRNKRRKLTTKAKNVMTQMLPYWEKNSVTDEKIRKKMGYE